jgi:hypothetical protein
MQLKIGKYVGRLFQEDEVITQQFFRITDDFSSKQEAIEWIESMIEELEEGGEGGSLFLLFNFKKCMEEHGKFLAIARNRVARVARFFVSEPFTRFTPIIAPFSNKERECLQMEKVYMKLTVLNKSIQEVEGGEQFMQKFGFLFSDIFNVVIRIF